MTDAKCTISPFTRLMPSSFVLGKTSLAKALVEGKAANITEDERTIGLDLYFWRPIPHKEELEILIVDCAGQRKYLLTHQFFFTEG